MRKLYLLAAVFLVLTGPSQLIDQLHAQAGAKAAETIELSQPNRTGGMTLAEALATRRSIRSFAATKLAPEEISQLLWAAQGVTDDKGHRTAPSARAQYFLHVYLATADGFFEYIPAGHKLQKLMARDIRSSLSSQSTVVAAPAVFLITGEYQRATQSGSQDTGRRWVDLEAGHAAQNLLLQATALKLGAVPVGGIQPKQIEDAASLPAGRSAIYLIPIGHTK